ncbi:MAG: D-alanyl-D-alanine carboxypeptidase/D-alanyl-D-alanine-endopeptidase [Candidatus Schekmanbacteria bacterium]|nr:D-alanyl-D-alanine carboxypeptidase/D-alanyl-D-alanine-endopeptidase [Candidatus Schekmanbacteria bacterium]
MNIKKIFKRTIVVFIIQMLLLPCVFDSSAQRLKAKPKAKPKPAPAVLKDYSPEGIKNEIKRVVTSGLLSNTMYGIYIKSLKTGEIIYSANENLLLIPASNMKIITSAVALDILGPEYTFNTDIYSQSTPSGGKIDGDLYIKGFGNPVLYPEDIWIMAKEISLLGINEVKGDIVVDGSYLAKSLAEQKLGSTSDSTVLSALPLNFNSVRYTVSPYNKSPNGSSPFISADPFSSYLSLSNNVKPGEPTEENTTQVTTYKNNDKGEKVVFNGKFNGKLPVTGYSRVNSPCLFTGESFRKLLLSDGVKVAGKVKEGTIPEKSVLVYRHGSKPLSQIIVDMNKYSNNFIADHLFVAVGAKALGMPATAEKSISTEIELFKKDKIYSEGIKIKDGSGLSKENRLTAHFITKVLEDLYTDLGQGPEFIASLPIMGVDGTLHRRLQKSPLKRHIRAKTGYVNGTSALSGYVMTDEKEPIVFSIIINNCRDVIAAKLAQDHIVETIASMKREVKTAKAS